MIFAAVDIGSNAMRLLFCRAYEVNGKPHFSKEELIKNLTTTDLIKSTRIYGDRMYLTLSSKANDNASDKRNDVSVNLKNGIINIKNLANGEYLSTFKKLEHLVNG